MKRKLVSLFAALALCLSLLPGTAWASDSEVQYSLDGGAWTEASLFDAITAGYAAKTSVEIKLNRDIILTPDNWSYSQAIGIAPSWNIDGGGHTIKHGSARQSTQIFTVQGTTLTLTNVIIDGGAVWSGEDAASRTNTGISHPGNSYFAIVDAGGTLVLGQGAVLQNNDLTSAGLYGAAVYLQQGTLVMKEGSAIRNNAVTTSGGGVQVGSGSAFRMEGGVLQGNYAGNNGGGVCINGGTFEMTDGSAIGNAAGAGGGISVFSGTAKLTGGQVSGNTITGSMGGGVLVHNGSLTVGGSIVVSDNTSTSVGDNNVYLNVGKTMSVEGQLTQGAQIGVTVHSSAAPTEGSPATVTGNAAASQYFTSDNLAYQVKNDASGLVQLVLRELCTVTFHTGTDEPDPEAMTTNAQGKLAELPELTRSGYTFDGWYTAETGGTKINTSTVFDENADVYARWLKNHTVSFVDNGEEIGSQVVADGRTATQPADPNRDGYTFAGWYTDAEGAEAFDFDTGITADLTLYAKWTEVIEEPEGPGEYIPPLPMTPSVPSTPSESTSTPSTPAQPDTPTLPVATGDQPAETGGTTTQTTATPEAATVDGTASSHISGEIADEIVRQAVDNGSETVVIAPVITGDVTRTEVSLPAETVGELAGRTGADLKVSTPIAETAIPNGGLGTLASCGGEVTVSAEKQGSVLELTITADGQKIENIPGGVTLTAPVEDAGPGTVAVLVRADGGREVVRQSLARDGGVVVPLSGSAKLEIVDNSKTFADVPAGSWAADAVAFASAHELFGGTSETAFSPDASMTRGMLAVVLHNLEGNPAAGRAAFTDVRDGAWYAAGIAWASAQSVVTGYPDGTFAPDAPVTREQLAVMLWRYAGQPASHGSLAGFLDAGEVSAYTEEAMRWAVETGIINGKGNGCLDPQGLATRAETAQMLKNFMESR